MQNTPYKPPFDELAFGGPALHDLARLGAQICNTSLAFIDAEKGQRYWFQSPLGQAVETAELDVSFYLDAMAGNGLFLIPDTLNDARFAGHPAGLNSVPIRFYAGLPLLTSTGRRLGSICVFDSVPRDLTPEQQESLHALGRQVVRQIELQRHLMEMENLVAEQQETEEALHESEEKYRDLFENAHDIIQCLDGDCSFLYVNQAWHETLGYTQDELPYLNILDVIHPDSLNYWKAI